MLSGNFLRTLIATSPCLASWGAYTPHRFNEDAFDYMGTTKCGEYCRGDVVIRLDGVSVCDAWTSIVTASRHRHTDDCRVSTITLSINNVQHYSSLQAHFDIQTIYYVHIFFLAISVGARRNFLKGRNLFIVAFPRRFIVSSVLFLYSHLWFLIGARTKSTLLKLNFSHWIQISNRILPATVLRATPLSHFMQWSMFLCIIFGD